MALTTESLYKVTSVHFQQYSSSYFLAFHAGKCHRLIQMTWNSKPLTGLTFFDLNKVRVLDYRIANYIDIFINITTEITGYCWQTAYL